MSGGTRFSAPLAASIAAVVGLALGLPEAGRAGAFITALNNNQVNGTQRALLHSTGYTGTGGTLTVTVCIDPDSDASIIDDLVIPTRNAVDRFNQQVPIVGNLFLGANNDIPSGGIDFESTLVHELGHCQGLAHVNLATESGEAGINRDFTKSGNTDGTFDLGFGPDGLPGSGDDDRGNDLNFHWFEVGVNNPFRIPLRPDIDPASYSFDLDDLPAGDRFAINAERDIATVLLGLPGTEAVMQQGAFSDENQRGLAADDVATLRLARAGFDRVAGTADDYEIELVYGGVSSNCDITVNMSGTSFAFCSVSSTNIGDDQRRVTSAFTRYGSPNNFSWYFTDQRIPAPEADSLSVPAGGTQTVLDNGQTSLLANDSHPDDDGGTLVTLALDPGSYGGPDHGTVVLNGDGTFSYTHDDDGSSEDFFNYRVCVAGTDVCTYEEVSIIIGGAEAESIAVNATPTPSSLDEPGGEATIEVLVQNNSGIPGTATITSLADSVAGSLNGTGSCAVPQALSQGQSYSCSYSASFSGNGDGSDSRTISAAGSHTNGENVEDDDDAIVAITDVPPAGTVTNVASPDTLDEPGGSVSWTVTVENTSSAEAVELIGLVDDLNGDLNGLGDCSVPQSIPGSGSYACTYEVALTNQAPGTRSSTTTATLEDDEGGLAQPEATAAVTIEDIAPSATTTLTATPGTLTEGGGVVNFTITVANTGTAEALNLTALLDATEGPLAGAGSCALPQEIAPGDSYGCSFDGTVPRSDAGSVLRSVSATVSDDDGNSIEPAGAATITITDSQPLAAATFSATPATIDELGGTLNFSVGLVNASDEDIQLTALVDSIAGNLAGLGTCALPRTIPVGGSFLCLYDFDTGPRQAGSLSSTLTATFSDDEANEGTTQAGTEIIISDVAPAVAVTLAASPATVGSAGGSVTFTVAVENTSPADAVTLTTLDENVLGSLDGRGDCALPQTIAIGGGYTCSYGALLAGPAGTEETRTVTASVGDEEGGSASGGAAAVVSFSDDAPLVTLARTLTAPAPDEPGGDLSFELTVTSAEASRTLNLLGLTDTLDGDLDGQGTCALPQAIAPGGSFSCSYGVTVMNASAAAPRTSTTTATVESDDSVAGSAVDGETVVFGDVPPSAETSYEATPAAPLPPEAEITFTINVSNIGSAEALTLTALTDDVVGSLAGLGSCEVPVVIEAGAGYECTISATVAGSDGETLERTLTATLEDDEGNVVTPADVAEVAFGARADAIFANGFEAEEAPPARR